VFVVNDSLLFYFALTFFYFGSGNFTQKRQHDYNNKLSVRAMLISSA